jgi:hypothetical protein
MNLAFWSPRRRLATRDLRTKAIYEALGSRVIVAR